MIAKDLKVLGRFDGGNEGKVKAPGDSGKRLD